MLRDIDDGDPLAHDEFKERDEGDEDDGDIARLATAHSDDEFFLDDDPSDTDHYRDDFENREDFN